MVRARSVLRCALVLSTLTACGGGPNADPSATARPELAAQGAASDPSRPICARPAPAFSTALGPAKSARGDTVDDALAMIGADRGSFGLDRRALAESALDPEDPRMLAVARSALARPLDLPSLGRRLGAAMDEALGGPRPVTDSILVASALRDEPIDPPCLDASWFEAPDEHSALAAALAELRHAPADDDEVEPVPVELGEALAPILRAIAAADREVELARAAAPADLREAIGAIPAYMLGIRYFEWSPRFAEALAAVDTRRIAAAAASVAFAIEDARLERFAGMALGPLDLHTPLGRIVLRGPADDVFDAGDDPPLLVLDTGGSDRYRGAIAATTLLRRVSILVDLGGADDYGYQESPLPEDAGRLPSDGAGRLEGRTRSRIGRQGAGVLGVALSFDLGGGDDRYRSLAGSQGSGSHGVGVLYDDGGDDDYASEGFSQGAAAWGIGLLLDGGGDDRYEVVTAGQGYAFSRGAGALVDRGGDDVYLADPGVPTLGGTLTYPSQQVEGANMSWAQGCGVGQRPDGPAPGYPLPGGVGVLRDARGDDRYFAGVFAQGCGFVQGLGMLLEGAGSDAYDGLYYTQAAGAHMGAALLVDESGDDAYDTSYVSQGPALGFAHDLSVAVALDQAGDDRYRAATLCLGSAYANGAALFADAGGADDFVTGSPDCFGAAFTADVGPARRKLETRALFVKSGGPATYLSQGKSDARGGSHWRARGAAASAVERGAAIDAPSGRIEL